MQESKSTEELEREIRSCDRTLERHPDDDNALWLKALALVELADQDKNDLHLQESLQCYDKAIEHKPDNGIYRVGRAELKVKMGDPKSAIEDIYAANEAPGGVMAKAYVSYTATELAKLNQVKDTIAELQSDPNVSNTLLAAFSQLTDVTEDLVVVSGVHEERLGKHDGAIKYLMEEVQKLSKKVLSIEEADQKTQEVLLQLNERVTTLEGSVKLLNTNCDSFKEALSRIEEQNAEKSSAIEQKIETIQKKLSWQGDQALVQKMNKQLILLTGTVKRDGAQIDDVWKAIAKMDQEIDENSEDIKEINGKIATIEDVMDTSITKLPNIGLLPQVLQEHEDKIALEEQFTELHADPYTAAIYDSVRFQLNAVWNASRVVKTGIVDHKMSGKVGIVGKLMQSFGDKVPVVGSAVKLLGSLMSYVDKNTQTERLNNFASLATNEADMDFIADSIAREIAGTKLDKATIRDTDGVLAKISSYCSDVLSKSKKKVVKWLNDQQDAAPAPDADQKEEGIKDGNIIAGILVSQLFKGDLLDKSSEEIIAALSTDIVATYQEHIVAYLTDVVYENPGVQLLYDDPNWQKYGKSAEALLQLGERYSGHPGKFQTALLGNAVPTPSQTASSELE